MLILQHNCGREYESIIMAFETALNIGAGIMMLQEPVFGNRDISQSAFKLSLISSWKVKLHASNNGNQKITPRQDYGRSQDRFDQPSLFYEFGDTSDEFMLKKAMKKNSHSKFL